MKRLIRLGYHKEGKVRSICVGKPAWDEVWLCKVR